MLTLTVTVTGRYCRLSNLLDLDQGNPDTRAKIVAYMNDLIDIGVAGFRIDAAKHMHPDELLVLRNELNDLPVAKGFPQNTRPWFGQEVTGNTYKPVHSVLGPVTEFTYASHLVQKRTQNKGLAQFKRLIDQDFSVNWIKNYLPDRNALVFVTNHDKQRTNHGNMKFSDVRGTTVLTG